MLIQNYYCKFTPTNKYKMKVQAKDLKVGNVIRYKIISEATITQIEEFTQKNGKPCLSIKIEYGKQKLCHHRFDMKPQTKVDLRFR